MTPQENDIAPLTKKQISDQARGIAVRERNVAAYNLNPKLCEYCGEPIRLRETVGHTRRLRFCTQSCGAFYRGNNKDRKAGEPIRRPNHNLVGQVFGRLTVVSQTDVKNKWGAYQCSCVCVCGKDVVVAKNSLVSGNTKSCGCLHRELLAELSMNGAIPLDVQGPRYVFSRYKSSARDRDHEFLLTLDEFTKIIESPCDYCGIENSISHKRKRDKYLYNGVDRVDSQKGYIPGNCVPCCPTCNYAKNRLSLEKFQAWITRIADFHANKYLSPWA